MDWTVVDKIPEAIGTVTIRFRPKKPVGFKPGQYFMFYDVVDGLEECRAYSASSSPLKEYVDITIKLVKDALFSKHLQGLVVGDEIEVRGPFGDFFFEDPMEKLVLIGAGSGIAPLRSIIEYSAQREGMTLTVIYSVKDSASIIFKEQLERLAADGKLRLFVTLTQAEGGQHHGRISEELIREAVHDLSGSVFFVCGPPAMVTSVEKLLVGLGVGQKQIHSEKF